MGHDRDQPLEDGAFILPTVDKEKSWGNFLNVLPELKKADLPTKETLPRIHAAITKDIEPHPFTKVLAAESVVSVICLDRDPPVDHSMFIAVRQAIREAINAHGPERILNGQVADVQFHARYQVKGALREHGDRIIDGRRETVYAPTMTPFFQEDGSTLRYVTLSRGLKEVYTLLCDTYDRSLEQAKLPGEKIKAMAFFQGFGALALHPFADANGRAFSAQFIYDLNTMGVEVADVPSLGELNPVLSNNIFALFGEVFLKEFLQSNGIPLLTEKQTHDVIYDGRTRNIYMNALKDALQKAIAKGPFKQDRNLDQLLIGGVHLINIWLSKMGVLPRSNYDEAVSRVQMGRKR